MEDLKKYKKSKDFLEQKLKSVSKSPKIAIVLGTAFSSVIKEIEDDLVIPYGDIPYFLETTVENHKGDLHIGSLYKEDVIIMSGRFHYYEGYDYKELALPFRVLKLLGVEYIILTNAAGAVNSSFSVGELMVIEDYIKLMGDSPLRGKNYDEFGPRFLDVGNIFNKDIREKVFEISKKQGLKLNKGVYFYFKGPQYETPAEIRAVRTLGGDAVGMSTIPDALVCHHTGIKIFAFSLITNMAAGMVENIDHKSIYNMGEKSSTSIAKLIEIAISVFKEELKNKK